MTRRIYVKPRPPAKVEGPDKPTVDTLALDTILAVAGQLNSGSTRIDTQDSNVVGRSIVDSDMVPSIPRHRHAFLLR